MRILLDTHAFLWFNLNDTQLSSRARSTIVDGSNDVFVSAVTAWEIAIKYSRGKLELPQPPDIYVPARMAHYSLERLLVDFVHALRVAHLPDLHRDPFDRLLVAQSQAEGLPIVTSDPMIARYDVEVIW